MPQPSESHPSAQADDSLFDLFVEALDNMEESVRAAFLQQFFKSLARVELTSSQSLEYWRRILERRTQLSELLGTRISLKTAIVDVLASAAFLRVPILMEYEEFKKLQLNAATDPLTGLYNRRLFDEYCDKEFNRAQRYGQHLALVLVDLHQLKEVNDRYGHVQGDQILQLTAATLRKNLRASDFAFRIGGDEFALLLPQADSEQSAALCGRLRAQFEAESAPLKLTVPVSIDYGVAVYPEDGESRDALSRLADQRLYEHKAASRRRGESPHAPSEQSASKEIPINSKTAPRNAGQVAQDPAEPSHIGRQTSQSAPPKAAEHPGSMAPVSESKPHAQRRKWERISLAGTRAYAVFSGDGEKTAPVVDLCTGGLAISVDGAESLPPSFFVVLHVPILPPIRVNLRKIYTLKAEEGRSRVGCAFVS